MWSGILCRYPHNTTVDRERAAALPAPPEAASLNMPPHRPQAGRGQIEALEPLGCFD